MKKLLLVQILGMLTPFLTLCGLFYLGRGASISALLMLLFIGFWNASFSLQKQGKPEGAVWQRTILVGYLVIGTLGLIGKLIAHHVQGMKLLIPLVLWIILPGAIFLVNRQDT